MSDTALDVVNKYLEFSRRDDPEAHAALSECFAPDVTWTIFGRTPISGVHQGVDAIIAFRRKVFSRGVPGTLQAKVRNVLASDQRVFMEISTQMRLLNGKDYRNAYVFVYEVENGKIKAIREYNDTQLVAEDMFEVA